MLEMPDSVESALHCTWLLAQQPATALPARRLAEFHGLPQAYLSKILKLLTRADVLRAVPGTGGGYRLARDPEEITVLDILTAVQGNGPMFRCRELRQRGPVPLPVEACRRPCGIAAVMHRAEQAWRQELAATTLAALHSHAATASIGRARRWLDGLPDS